VRPFFNVVAGLVAAGLAGCANPDVRTNPNTFSVEPAALSQLRRPQTVALNNAYETETKVPLMFNKVRRMADLKQHTDTAIVMLRRAMEKQGITVAQQAEKTMVLRLRPIRVHVQLHVLHNQTDAAMFLEVEFGDGTTTTTRGQKTSSAAESAFDGAILDTLNRLLTDEKFVAYMNR
jgi:hypothetical protein